MATRYRKELIHAGTFVKDGQEFRVDGAALRHWKRTFDAMRRRGVEVPVPVEHTRDPERRRGTVVEMELGTNLRGEPALFGVFEFRDGEAPLSSVSIYAPPSFTDGLGTRYVRPITHVALTDYPVVPGLDPWLPLAASRSAPLERDADARRREAEARRRKYRLQLLTARIGARAVKKLLAGTAADEEEEDRRVRRALGAKVRR